MKKKNSYEILDEINKKQKMNNSDKFIIFLYIIIIILCIIKLFITQENSTAWLVSAILAFDSLLSQLALIKINKKYETLLEIKKDIIYAINDVITKHEKEV